MAFILSRQPKLREQQPWEIPTEPKSSITLNNGYCLGTPGYPSDSRWWAGCFWRSFVLLMPPTLLLIGCCSTWEAFNLWLWLLTWGRYRSYWFSIVCLTCVKFAAFVFGPYGLNCLGVFCPPLIPFLSLIKFRVRRPGPDSESVQPDSESVSPSLELPWVAGHGSESVSSRVGSFAGACNAFLPPECCLRNGTNLPPSMWARLCGDTRASPMWRRMS